MGRSGYYVVISARNEECSVFRVLGRRGVGNLRINGIRVVGGKVLHLVEDVGGAQEEGYRVIESSGCALCRSLLSSRVFLVSGRMVEYGRFIYSFIVPDADALKELVERFSEWGDFEVLKVKRLKRRGEVLTGRQERVLWIALKSGFFDYPRKVGTAQLASMIGVSPSTVSETIRRGLKRLLKAYYEDLVF